jgi:outer membrane biosynthesis protein TonB
MRTETSHNQRNSLIITTLVYGLLLLLLFFLRFWPPANIELMGGGGGGGIEMNFGDSDYGMGDNYQSEVLNVKDQAKETPVQPSPEEDVISDDNADNVDAVIPKKEIAKKTPVAIKKEVKPVIEKPKVSKNANDALSSLLGNKGGDGDDGKSGNKGSANGSLGSKGYYGNGSGTGTGGGNGSGNGTGSGSGTGSGNGSGNGGGNGSGSGYYLGNRKALSKPDPQNPCGNESGRVAVEVKVDRNGNTVSVKVGVQGTTNANSCLKEQAKLAAMNTKWSADPNASEIQVGKIIYGFGLK